MRQVYFILIALVLLFFSCSKKQDTQPEPEETIKVEITLVDSVLFNGTEISISAQTDAEIKEARFYFDGLQIGSSIVAPYMIKYKPVDIEPGEHEINCIVVSISGKEFHKSIPVHLKLRLGDTYQGGIVFYFYMEGISGLIAAKEDLYHNGTDRFYWADNIGIGRNTSDGFNNTKKMAEHSSNDEQVGYLFKQGYSYEGYDDWYIPAKDELVLMKENKNMIGGFAQETNWQGLYWSSSELSDVNAEALNFNSLMGNTYGKNSYSLKVRLIRKF